MRKYAVALAVLLVASACSGGSDTTSSATTVAPAATQALSTTVAPATTVAPTTTTVAPATTVAPTTTTATVEEVDSRGVNCPSLQTYSHTPRVSGSFVDIDSLETHRVNIPNIAWNDSQTILDGNADLANEETDLLIKVGPTTNLYFAENEAMLRRAINFWTNFCQPTKYIALYYSYDDLSWAEEELVGYGETPASATVSAMSPCGGGICIGGNSGLGVGQYPNRSRNVGFGKFGIHQADATDPYRRGPLHIHEYTHAMQASSWINTEVQDPQGASNQASPCWLNEGFPHAIGLSAGTDDYSAYLSLRNGEVIGRHLQGVFDDYGNVYSTQTIVDYFDNSVPGTCIGKKDYAAGYSIGLLTVEALNAVAGSESAMHLYTYMASGLAYQDAFEVVYGLPWDSAKSLLAAHVSVVVNSVLQTG